MSEIGWEQWRAAAVEEASRRLDAILNDKVMRFNPYKVGDEELLACAERGYLRPTPALTQMVIFHFLDIRTITKKYPFDAILFRIGNSPKEYYFHLSDFFFSMAHHASKMPERIQINGKNIIRSNVAKIQNRSFFVSHGIYGNRAIYPNKLAYKMFRLKGGVAKQASVIRQQMCLSKITMLKEVLNYPTSHYYLGSGANSIDYATPIHDAIEAIRRYPPSPIL